MGGLGGWWLFFFLRFSVCSDVVIVTCSEVLAHEHIQNDSFTQRTTIPVRVLVCEV